MPKINKSQIAATLIACGSLVMPLQRRYEILLTSFKWRLVVRISPVLAIISVFACSTVANSQSVDVQEKCATQATKTFRESYSGPKVELEKETYGQKTISSDYRSHYNTKINKCLLLIEEQYGYPKQNNKKWTLIILTEAFKQRDYANLLQVKTESQTEVMVCELRPSSKKKKRCTTREELDAFVADYMEQ